MQSHYFLHCTMRIKMNLWAPASPNPTGENGYEGLLETGRASLPNVTSAKSRQSASLIRKRHLGYRPHCRGYFSSMLKGERFQYRNRGDHSVRFKRDTSDIQVPEHLYDTRFYFLWRSSILPILIVCDRFPKPSATLNVNVSSPTKYVDLIGSNSSLVALRPVELASEAG
jgi:hypothetical protein